MGSIKRKLLVKERAMKTKKYFKIGAWVILIFSLLVIFSIISFPDHKSHNTILRYMEIVISYPAAIIVSLLVVIYLIWLIFFREPKTKFVEVGRPDVTGFIKIIEKTKDGNLIVKNKKNKKEYKIENGDVIVNEAFVLKYRDNAKKIESLEHELERYRERLLEG